MKVYHTKTGQSYIKLANGRAKFIKNKHRTIKRSVSIMAKKHYSKSRSGGMLKGQLPAILGAGVYGALRQRLSNALAPVTSKVPLGNISDEVVIGGLLMLSKKAIKNPMFHKVANAGIMIESARIGEAIANGQLSIGTGAAVASNTEW